MAYAINVSQVQTVTEQLHVDLVARASMLNDKMLDDLQITVTTDVENIDKLFLFNATSCSSSMTRVCLHVSISRVPSRRYSSVCLSRTLQR